MRNPRAPEIKVGITVLLGILVFIWVLGWAKNFTLSSTRGMYSHIIHFVVRRNIKNGRSKSKTCNERYFYI